MSLTQAAIAATRFGLGGRPGEIAALAEAGPAAALARQIESPPRLSGALAGLPLSHERVAAFLRAREKGNVELVRMLTAAGKEAYAPDVLARIAWQTETEAGFHERLVQFWSNHFTVSSERPQCANVVVPFENEAIRPNVTGRFADLLIAVVRHPAMLLYLDNVTSFGPNSRGGRWTDRGLNENLAREILELHTLGVEGGYSQADVTEFAKILTGWTIQRPQDGTPGAFQFAEIVHEPGNKTLLGVTYREDGMAEGERALRDLARQPATARFIATKLARHFVADRPPPRAVDHLARVFLDSDGDLKALSLALIALPEAWDHAQSKVKTPQELVISTTRALGTASDGLGALGSLKEFGQIPLRAPSPAGWPDSADDWIGPEAMIRRVDWATAAAAQIAPHAQPLELLDVALGGLASEATRTAVSRAPSAKDGIALLLASPEFQRR